MVDGGIRLYLFQVFLLTPGTEPHTLSLSQIRRAGGPCRFQRRLRTGMGHERTATLGKDAGELV